MAADQNDELRTRFAAGETEGMPPAPPSGAESVRRDTAYAPGSEAETEQKQENPIPDSIDDDIDTDDVRAVPGTGGPDDVGDVDVDPDDLELPWQK